MIDRGLFRRNTQPAVFPTPQSPDIVILMDTIGSMSRSIEKMKEKYVECFAALKEEQMDHRFCLIGFGDRQEGIWHDVHEFTREVKSFKGHVATVNRIDGGDLPESALDAIEVALDLTFDADATRRFYPVTDADYHELTQSVARAVDLV